MEDDRIVMMSVKGYKNMKKDQNGKGVNWTCDINDELPIKLKRNEPGSEPPLTLCTAFLNAVKFGRDRPSMYVERGGKYICWTWQDYYRDAMKFSKALAKLNVTTRSAVGIMGFNSPEWAISFVGAINYEAVVTGIYTTNAPDACLYQATHCDAEVIVMESLDHLKRFTCNLDKYPQIKAFVVWGEQSLPTEFQNSRYFLWNDFLKLGNDLPDDVILQRMNR